jgi:retron-type reverse transcriptase
VNRLLTQGVVPTGLKIGWVCPVYKGGSKPRDTPSSYRPVSILPSMSKIMETLVKSDLEKYFTITSALPGSQHGFRPGRSCTTALGTAHSGWLSGIRSGKIVGVASYDLSAAFDTLAADKLLPKLERIGVRGTTLA